jgi:hypothetical protein
MAIVMRPHHDRPSGPGPHHWCHWCAFHASDTWLLVDAILTMLAAVITIAVLALRHPLTVVTAAMVVMIVGAITGWW